MAITLITSPLLLEPVYTNTIPFVVSSTLSANSNFRYIFKLYTVDQITGVPTYKTTINPFPRPDTNGLYSVHYVLKDNVSYTLNPLLNTITSASNSVVHYQIQVGEEWNPQKTWIDTQYAGGALSLTFSVAHTLLQGDIILLNKTDKSINPTYDGTASVVSVPNIYNIVTDKTFLSSTVLEGGIITDVLRMSFTSSVYRAYNGKRQYVERTDLFEDFYIATDATSRWLTSYSDYNSQIGGYAGTKGLYRSDYQTLSYIAATAGIVPTHAIYKFYSNGIIQGTYSVGITSSVAQYKRIDVPTGPSNWVNTPTISTLFNTCIYNGPNGYYTVQMATWSGSATASPTYMTQPFRYSFNKGLSKTSATSGCSSATTREYPIIQIAFLNDFGAFEYLSFNLVSKTTIKINRKKYKKVLAYNYTIGDRGDTIYDQTMTEELSANSDFLTDEEALQVRIMVSSPEVYIISQYDPITGTTNTYRYPVIITSDSYTIQNSLNDQLFQFNITMEKAYQIF